MKKVRSLALPFAGILVVSTFVSRATTIAENFSADPAAAGWSSFGNTNLFHWSAANQNLDVTWDSSQSNSFFCHGLGTNLTKASDFMLAFDLRLGDIAVGVDTNKPFTFEIALGLINLAQATNAGFIRGSGYQSPDLVEFDYFPNDVNNYGETISTPIISSANEYSSGGFTFPLPLATNALYHVTMIYTADDRTLRTLMTSNGAPFGPIQDSTLGAGFSDFSVDHFGVNSYSDAGQFPGYEGSVLAHGVVDNFVFAAPPPVTKVAALPGAGGAQVQFRSTTNWLYSLERTTTFQTWSGASSALAGTGAAMTLQDTNPPAGGAFYRVAARLP
jgi:hypothetical protein